MIKIQKDNSVITVTQGAYNEFYKKLGYKPVTVKLTYNSEDAIEIPFRCKEDKPNKKKNKK